MSFDEIRSLLYPTTCISCGAGSKEICPRCESALTSFRDVAVVHHKPLYSALHYNETSAHLILAAKENNDRASARYLASLMAMRFSRVHRDLHYEKYLLIPIPSSKKADRRRGYEHMVLLGRLTAKKISQELSIDCSVARFLLPVRHVEDQSGLNARERSSNIDRALKARLKPPSPETGIILVDDLVTTGSTMGEAIRALKVASCEPDALLSACVAGRFLTNKIGPFVD